MDCSLPGSSIHGVFQARVLEWGAIAFYATANWKHFCGLSSPSSYRFHCTDLREVETCLLEQGLNSPSVRPYHYSTGSHWFCWHTPFVLFFLSFPILSSKQIQMNTGDCSQNLTLSSSRTPESHCTFWKTAYRKHKSGKIFSSYCMNVWCFCAIICLYYLGENKNKHEWMNENFNRFQFGNSSHKYNTIDRILTGSTLKGMEGLNLEEHICMLIESL